MYWLHLLICFLGGAFLANAVPHFVSGTMGRSFPSPFAKPPGRGLSSPVVNVVWGFANGVFAYFLLIRAAHLDLHTGADMIALGAGALLIGVQLAWHFGGVMGQKSA